MTNPLGSSTGRYHCPKCKRDDLVTAFDSLSDLRRHVLQHHIEPRSKDLNKIDGSNSDWTKNARTRSPMRYYNSDNKTVEELWDKIFNQPSSANGGSNTTVAEAIKQAKKQLEELRKTSNKAVSNQKEHIKKLSEQMRSKDGQLQSVDKELSWLTDENKKLKDEFQDTDKRFRQKEDEVARLTQLLRERDFMLQQKQEHLASQSKLVKTAEEKESIARKKLEKSVEKIIKRAETAEMELERIKKMGNAAGIEPPTLQPVAEPQKGFVDGSAGLEKQRRLDEARDVLTSCNSASAVTFAHMSSYDADGLSRMLSSPNSPDQLTPLAQFYLQNFVSYYKEIKLRESTLKNEQINRNYLLTTPRPFNHGANDYDVTRPVPYTFHADNPGMGSGAFAAFNAGKNEAQINSYPTQHGNYPGDYRENNPGFYPAYDHRQPLRDSNPVYETRVEDRNYPVVEIDEIIPGQLQVPPSFIDHQQQQPQTSPRISPYRSPSSTPRVSPQISPQALTRVSPGKSPRRSPYFADDSDQQMPTKDEIMVQNTTQVTKSPEKVFHPSNSRIFPGDSKKSKPQTFGANQNSTDRASARKKTRGKSLRPNHVSSPEGNHHDDSDSLTDITSDVSDGELRKIKSNKMSRPGRRDVKKGKPHGSKMGSNSKLPNNNRLTKSRRQEDQRAIEEDVESNMTEPDVVESDFDEPDVFDREVVESDVSDTNRTIATKASEQLDENSDFDGNSEHDGEQSRLLVNEVLPLVCLYLDVETLSLLSLVCKEWMEISRSPEIWKHLYFRDVQLSSKYLRVISKWCTKIQTVTLENLSGRLRRSGESNDVFIKNTRGCLEAGLESIFSSSQDHIVSIRIINCRNVITERCLWLVSCYCRLLQNIVYISDLDPAGPEVMWALGAGCRDVTKLTIYPQHPCSKSDRFNNKCVTVIGKCWPLLTELSIGGVEVDIKGLILIANSCQKLERLELDHMCEIVEEIAVGMCEKGLNGLRSLSFIHTPVTPKAVLHFHGACPHLSSITVQLAISDYFADEEDSKNRSEYEEIIEKIKTLQHSPGLDESLRLMITYRK